MPVKSAAPDVRGFNEVILEVDLRGQPNALIDELKRGQGPLAEHVCSIVEDARSELGIPDGIEAVPVVFLYRLEEAEFTVYRPRRFGNS